MSKTKLLTPQQSRRARGLLHWNLQDIASRCTITRVRLEQFERGDVPLMRMENETLLKLFFKHGIIINSHGDVLLREDAKEQPEDVSKDDNQYTVDVSTYEVPKPIPEATPEEPETEQKKKKPSPKTT